MKKFYLYIMSISLLLAGAMTFTSCDDDVLDAEDLSGEWVGDMGVGIDLGGSTYWAVSTYMAFYPDYEYATHGYGEEIDYFDNHCPYHHQNYFFHWWIQNRVLYIEYPGNHLLDVALPDYAFHYSYGRKAMSFTIDGAPHRLFKLSDYYYDSYYDTYYYDDYYSYDDWIWWNGSRIYDDGYYFDYTDWGYYGKQREGVDSDSVRTKGDSVHMKKSEELPGYKAKRDFSRVAPSVELEEE